MNLHQFVSILRARWVTAASILLAVVVLALGWVLLRPSQYTARAPVLVDVNAQEVGGGYSPALLTSYLATQLDVARSDRVAERVLQMVKDDPPAVLKEPMDATTPEAQQREQVKRLLTQLTVKPARESNIINIQWTGKTPAEAARVANAWAHAYVDTALDLKTNPAKSESAWFDDQVRTVREKLEKAQAKLSDYQQKAGIVGNDQMADHEMARLTTLATQLAQVQAQTTDAQSKRGRGGDTVAEVMQSTLVNNLKADINKLEAEIQQGNATMGPRHPQMLRMQAELAALRSRLAGETGRITSSIETSYQAGRQREQELQAALNAQRTRVLDLNKSRGMLAILQQDVQAAQREYEQVTGNAAKTRLAALTTQTNLVPLASAVEPTDSNGPSAKQALAVAGLAGLILGMCVALILELLNRRIRSVDDIMLATQLPVLASVPAATSSYHAALPGAARHRLAYSGSAT